MKLFYMQLMFLSHILFLLARINCTSEESASEEIVYCEKYDGEDEILARFVDDTTSVFNVSKIRGFFIFPTQYYQLNVKWEDKTLPVFFINGTRKGLSSLLKFCYGFDATKMQDNLADSTEIMEKILQVKKDLKISFPIAGEFSEFLKDIYSDADETEFDIIKLHTYTFFRIRCLVPVIYFENVNFIAKENSTSSNASGTVTMKTFPNFNREQLTNDKSLSIAGLGIVANYYNVAVFLKESSEQFSRLVFKILKSPFFPTERPIDLREFTAFQEADIEDKSEYNALSCLVIDKSSGLGLGYLTHLEHYGELKVFIGNHLKNPDAYFFQQLLELAKSIKSLHLKGTFHNKISARHVLVDKICSSPFQAQSNNYIFKLAYFDDASICHGSFVNESVFQKFLNYGKKLLVPHSTHDKFTGCSLKEKDCQRCEYSSRRDWTIFSGFLSETFKLLALKHVKQCNYDKALVLTVSLKKVESYTDAESYLSDIISNKEFDMNENDSETYKFNEDAAFLIVNYHGNNKTFHKGDLMITDGRFNYDLYYSISGENENVFGNPAIFLKKINEFAKKHHKIECLIELRKKQT